MNQSLMKAHAVEEIKAASQPFEAPEPQQLTKIEQITAKNLKTGLYIFLLLGFIGLALDTITK